MSPVIWVAALTGLMSTAVIFGTDAFFFLVGRAALRSASEGAAAEVMGYIHLYGDKRMPMLGILAMLSNLVLVFFSGHGQRGFYLLSLATLIFFVVVYNRLSKPINVLQTEAAQTGKKLDDGRGLQAAWDRTLKIRVPLLAASMLAQCIGLVAIRA